MRSCFLTAAAFSVILLSCSGPSTDQQTTAASADTIAVDSAIHTFFHWYEKNYQEINAIPLVIQGDGDTTVQYRVDFRNTKQYLDLFMQSGLVTEHFTKDYDHAFHVCDSAMLADKQTDGPPYGFEADMILCSQDPDYSFEEIFKAKGFHTQIKDNSASSEFGEGKTRIVLAKMNGKWLIDRIGCYSFLNK